MPAIPEPSVVMVETLVVTSPAGPTGGGPAIPRSSTGSVVGVSDVPVGVHTGGEPVVQGSCHGSVSALVWFVVWGGGGVGSSPFASGCPDPRPTGSSPHVGESDADGGRSGLPDLF